MTPEHVTVVIPTRERGALVVRAIGSILANGHPPFDVIVVDQSGSNATAQAVSAFARDSRLHYVRTPTRGISAGRNLGNRLATGSIIANTDDDCEVPSDWVKGIRSAFEACPVAAIVMGSVKAAPHPPDGFIPAYTVAKPLVARSVRHKHRIEGIGACFAHRAHVWRHLGGFDERLGSGAQFPSSEETDFVIRALAGRLAVYETPSFEVVHHGFRRWDQAGALISDYLRGIGAMSAKQLRLNGASYLYVLARLAARWAWGRPVVDLGHVPPKLLRLRAFLGGFRNGWTMPIDRHGCFASPASLAPTPSR